MLHLTLAEVALQKATNSPQQQKRSYREALEQWQKAIETGELDAIVAKKTKEKIESFKHRLAQTGDEAPTAQKYATPTCDLSHKWEDMILDQSTKSRIYYDIVFYLKHYKKLDGKKKNLKNLFLFYGYLQNSAEALL